MYRGHVSSSDCAAGLDNFRGRGRGGKCRRNRPGLSLSSCIQARKAFQGGRRSDRCHRRRNRPEKCASKNQTNMDKNALSSCPRLRRLSNPPHRRTPLHPHRHERVPEGFRLAFLPRLLGVLRRKAGGRSRTFYSVNIPITKIVTHFFPAVCEHPST